MESFFGCIHTADDAIRLINMARHGTIPRIVNRLDRANKSMIRNGSIFVYSEKESKIKRWTDGRNWSPSRYFGMFLTYYQIISKKKDFKKNSNDNNDNPLDAIYKINNSHLFLKKTVTASIESDTFHIIAYSYIENEVNGGCCSKWIPSIRQVYGDAILPKNILIKHAINGGMASFNEISQGTEDSSEINTMDLDSTDISIITYPLNINPANIKYITCNTLWSVAKGEKDGYK
ncbi:cAMP-independent regulatory protein pac2 [Astathelohania contejeani]|uniref:cAMP-independent regulatory protein pac2 n=1 Tax=Astathelohania contejeani TaxID=164912 RepID=A0ABQ7I050_9MICR|nr:cAMP-independent regulatory protein pac2 [Thelohania contejeani]